MSETKWIRTGPGTEEASEGILSNAPGRARLVQSHRQTESPHMSESQEYQAGDPRGKTLTRSSGGKALPPEVRGGGLYTPASQAPRRRKSRGEKESRDE